MNLLLSNNLLANIPQTVEWNLNVAIIMITANLLAVFIGRFAIQKAGIGPDLPVEKPSLWKKFGLPELLATLSFGHILGAGFILGLSNAGLL
ncbi:MAG: photosystem I reaction center subunit PsaK [Cyanobacteria bacterium]|nr:photosystem I reaction center subunit PsaK [Cyanobacteria bacterium CG_2015-16_32_12]NCO79286.1 photosystem I reaction center subunit PsaK [Cyanobacteria bacterium CG_2015-22_32_23]NCQ05393.1 photosystem I reaction center subunit PsaK [Cyanobacteria bacterium CG_2015-09_32_10]NCQ41650.1 photosystem I reaction center subunit PsaK [Cyanobacteria bacterium CG_2015-04_32_10]NCS85599.1 photosystem I reaction center subunit PsaK [Cyanobacteria bacterium CG_2015-02_32_10]